MDKLKKYTSPLTNKSSVFVQGRAKNSPIVLPDEWRDVVDPTSLSVHLTEIGAKQNLVVKGIQDFKVEVQTHGLPLDCYYLVFGERVDVPDSEEDQEG